MWFDGMTEEALHVWLEIKDGVRQLADLSAREQAAYHVIEALNRTEDDLKLARQGKAFGHQGPDTP